ncbi:putative lecithin:cholesterol acyltransferase [Gottschalkia acidurici 9a]|uniref:Lecithin:cholesterol acyltransferase n=2 Tax=Clostridium acidurici TaxID=1556 RepID=K0AW45_GOTA9|nr:putative lecithin:cholesterol acyltransferase [Gottschalkia acidurici 9a]
MIFKKIRSKKRRNPIIFLHGIFGSIGDSIIPGTGDLDFGIAEFAYRPIINTLNEMGYEEGKNLFIAYYDWTKSNVYSAKNYLIPTIQKAKEVTGCRKVDIISHSMGGIVGRAYAQSNLYQNDIDKFIMIGTPNAGAIGAYYFWSGGEIPYEKIENNILYKIIKKGFLWSFQIKYKEKMNMDLIRKKFPSVQELLPNYDYGNYLLLNDSEEREYIPIENMQVRNTLLNELNKNSGILKKRRIKVYLIIGTNIETNKEITVRAYSKNTGQWEDGRPVDNIKTKLGDGTVICDSSAVIEGRSIYIDSNHTDILADSKYALSSILQIPIPQKISTSRRKVYKKIHSILANDVKDIKINIDGKEKSISSCRDYKSNEVIIKKLFEDTYWIVIKSEEENKIKINISSLSCEGNILIYTGDINSGIIKTKNIQVKDNLSLSI